MLLHETVFQVVTFFSYLRCKLLFKTARNYIVEYIDESSNMGLPAFRKGISLIFINTFSILI